MGMVASLLRGRDMKRLIASMCLLALAVGCTSNEEKVQRVLERTLEECKVGEGDFAEVTVVEGKDQVLRETCASGIKDLKLIDDYHATAMIGPYTYTVGIDNETGVWVLTQVDWESLADSRRALAGGDPPKDARERAEPAFAKAQGELPGSVWIRRQRFENLLAIRKLERNKDEDRISLGAAVQSLLDENVKWANENDQKGFAAELRLMVVAYQKAFASALEESFGNLGGSDEHLEATIRQAEKDGDKESAEKYRATLEKERAERPAKIKRMQDEIVAARKAACAQLNDVDPNALEGDAKTNATAVKGGTKCTPDAFEPPDPADFMDTEEEEE